VNDRIKVVDVELRSPPEPLGNLDGYQKLRALVRLHGAPIGHVELPLPDTGFGAADLKRIILRRLEWPILRHHLTDALESPLSPDGLGIEELSGVAHPASEGLRTLITVAVCTRDRTEELKLCLDALLALDYPDSRLELLVVDNAPSDDATRRLVEDLPEVRYVREHRPGLSRARNRAIMEARGEVIAFTDDDVIVDERWVGALAGAFSVVARAITVTGLVVPYELESEAQVLFERYGGFGRGYERRRWRMDLEDGERPFGYLGAGRYGTGANMAYRREVFEEVGLFDPALGAGTLTNGGEDLDIFFRVLRGGHVLAYEPSAMVRHRHRREYARLRKQLADNASSVSSTLVRTARVYPEARGDAVRFWLWWFWRGHLRRLAGSFARPKRFPRDLIMAELWSFLAGLGRYPKARRRAPRTAHSNDGVPRFDSEVETG